VKNIARFSFSALVFLLALVLPTAAQSHSVALSAQPSVTTGVSAYNVYRANCTTVTAGVCTTGEGTYAVIGQATIGATITYTDATVKGGFSYSYYMTSVCPAAGCGTDGSGNKITGESAAGNKVGAAIPGSAPLPPGNLAITTISRNTQPDGTTVVSATWVSLPNMQTVYTFYGNGLVLSRAALKNSSGVYVASWTGKVNNGSDVSFEVCTQAGECASKLI
jgi:hypothetical protein